MNMHQELSPEKINEIISSFPPQREYLLKAMHAIQNEHPQHYLSELSLDELAKYFNLTKGQVYGIASYYSMFSLKPRGKYIIRLCKSPVCSSMGSSSLYEYLEKEWSLKPNTTTTDGLFTLEASECIGRCGKAPSMMINEQVYTELNPDKLKEIITNLK